MTIDVQVIAAWITALGTIVGVFIAAYKLVSKHFLEKIKALDKRVAANESWNQKQQEDILNAAEEKRLLMKGVLACLDGLKQLKCNGNVTKVYGELNEFLYAKAHGTKSK